MPTSKKIAIPLAVLLAILACAVLLPLLSFPGESAAKSLVWIECRYCYTLTAPGYDTLYFNGIENDTLPRGLSSVRSKAEHTQVGQGCWFSYTSPIHFPQGSILTTSSVAQPDTALEKYGRNVARLASAALRQTKRQRDDITRLDSHLVYYIKTHDVQDEGYTHIAQYEDHYKTTFATLSHLQDLLTKISMASSPQVGFLATYTCRHITAEGRLSDTALHCRRIKTYPNGLVMLRTTDGQTPRTAASLSYPLINGMKFTSSSRPLRVWLAGMNLPGAPDSIEGKRPDRIEGRAWHTAGSTRYATSLPLQTSSRGIPVVNCWGILVGLADEDSIIAIP